MKFINKIFFLVMLATGSVFTSCNKENLYNTTIPQAIVHFDGDEFLSYAVRTTVVDTLKIEVGTSDVSSADRSVTFNITSTTGAVAGTQYNIIGSNTVVIPAGKATAKIQIQGILAGYPTGRIDTLILTLAQPSIKVAQFSDTVRIAIGDICTEGVGFDVNTFSGTYNNCFDIQPPSPNYGPYVTDIDNIVTTSSTSATITINNFWDVGTSITNVSLNWVTPGIATATIPTQILYNDPTYGPATITDIGGSKFSSCNNTFTFKYKVTVAAGSFGNFTTTIAR